MQVSEIMNTDVKTIGPGETIQRAAEILSEYRIGGVVVATDNRLAGILTERDIISKVVAAAKDPQKTLVKNVMTKNVFYITPDTDVEEAADIMMDKQIKKLPVVDKGTLVGIVTATNVCTAQPKMLEKMSDYLFSPKKKSVAG